MLFANTPISRRQALLSAGCEFGYLALAGLASGNQQPAPRNPLEPRAYRVILGRSPGNRE